MATKGKDGGPPPQGWPAECPVTPLGMSADGSTFYYLDPAKRLHVLQAKDHSRLGILRLLNERWMLLMDYGPRRTKVREKKPAEVDYIPTGGKPERAAEEGIAKNARKVTWNT